METIGLTNLREMEYFCIGIWCHVNWSLLKISIRETECQNNQAYYHNVNAFPKTLTPLLTYLHQRMRNMITMQKLFAKALVLARSLFRLTYDKYAQSSLFIKMNLA